MSRSPPFNRTLQPYAIPLLALGQGLLLTGNAMLVSVNGLSGLVLAPDVRIATLPVTCFVLGGALSTLPMSLLMQRRGRSFGFALGCLAAVIGAMLTAVAIATASFPLLCLGTFVIGFYNAAGQYLRFAAVDLAPPERAARALSLVLAGGLFGAFLGPALSRATIDMSGQRFLVTYLSLIILALLFLGLTRLVHFPVLQAKAAGSHDSAKVDTLLRRPGFWLAVASSAGAWATMNLLMTASPLAMQACAYPFSDAAWALQWHMVGMYLPMLFSGFLIERLGVRLAIGSGIVCIAGCAVIALTGTSVRHFVAALSLLGIGWALMFTGGNALLTLQYTPAQKGMAQGIHDTLMFSAMVLSSLLAGRAATLTGWRDLQWLALGLMALLMGLLLLLGRKSQAPAAVAIAP